MERRKDGGDRPPHAPPRGLDRPAPDTVWWTWTGAPYRAFFDRLPADRTTATAHGVLFENSAEPLARDDLAPLSTWLPEALFAALIPDSGNWQPVPVNRAAEIPEELR